jgi:hypothetical protein
VTLKSLDIYPHNANWQYCQSGDTNVDSSETSGIMKLSPD